MIALDVKWPLSRNKYRRRWEGQDMRMNSQDNGGRECQIASKLLHAIKDSGAANSSCIYR